MAEEATLKEKLRKAKHGKKDAALEEAKKLEESDKEELRKTLEFKPARSVLVRILVNCKIFQSTMNTNALNMAFAEGKKQMGIELLENIARVSPKHRNKVIGEYYDYTSSRAGKHKSPVDAE